MADAWRRLAVGTLLVCCLADSGIAGAADAEPRAMAGDERQTFLNRMRANLAAWSFQAGDARYDEAGPDYSKRPDAVFLDPIPPLEGYRGWEEYRHAVPNWIKAGIKRGTFSVDDEDSFRAWRLGDVVWTLMRCGVALIVPGDVKVESKCRGTTVWEWEGDDWRLVHETFSTPMPATHAGFQGERRADPRIEPHPEFLVRARNAAAAWGAGPIDDLAARLRPHYMRDATVFTPWEPLSAYEGWDAFGRDIQSYLAPGFRKVSVRINDDLEAHQRGHLAWSHATVRVETESRDGIVRAGNGRLTQIWLMTSDEWRIAHEHFAFPQTE